MSIVDKLSNLGGYIPDNIIAQLPDVCTKFSIDGPLRLSHLLGNCRHESANFTKLEENLNYSAEALWSLFHSHFSSAEEAATYARQPERIANRIYANRMGNGGESSGDGYLHRGYGALQITGKANQGDFFEFVGLPRDSDPSLIATQYPIASGAYFFLHNGLWSICDQGIGLPVITAVRKRVNGGTLGLQEVIDYTTHCYHLLTS